MQTFRQFGVRTILLPLCVSSGMLVARSAPVLSQGNGRREIATLNHFWAALDDQTAGAVITSSWLKTFANVVVNTVTPARTRHVESIGHSTLTVGPGRRAVWTFSRAP